MEPPKRQLALTGAGAGREEAKRLRVGVANPSAAGWQAPTSPASPGTRLMRRTVLVVLFLLRMSDAITVTESISQIGRMVQRKMEGFQKVQALMMRQLENFEEKMEAKLENLEEKLEGKLGNLEEKMESKSQEVELARFHSNRHADKHPRSEPYQEGATLSEPNANIRLRFLDGLKTPIYTDKIIASESNAAIRIGVFDGDKMINEGPLSKAKVEILVLRGDFCSDGQESWTEEEFNSHIAQGRHRQGSVLGGDCSAWLNNGEASLGKIRFREGSSRTPSRKFIVGGRVCTNRKIGGIRVQEAVMEPVTVLDRRNEANEKRHPPRLDDEVYRLEEISKDGIYHRRLKDAQIFKVEDFLKALNKDADELREMVLQIKKRSNAWERMVKHARECCLADRPELKAYHSVDGNVVIFFNCVHDLVGAIFYGVYISRDNFDPAKKAQAYELKECARGQLDILPFDYVMNGNLPEQVPSSTHSTLDAAFILGPDAALQPNENQLQYRINNITEPSHQNEYIHGDQSTVNTHYYQGESILPVGQQQPTIFTGELLHWPYERSGQVNIHSQMQAPMSMDGGSVMQASTSVQHNLLSQQFAPTQVQESMHGIHYSENPPNHAVGPSTWHDDIIPAREPSANLFPGPDYGNF
ncbi:calmodulin-binding protein 60 F-like [Triticum urartu]|uniref:calmodulin-binding protein 60 F-like n=1 Tax=Triticum urartu TaxID=4572 RepID=UPI00204376B1|nr:calmodulin-binding protein 60 F-like [Triticum urartu]